MSSCYPHLIMNIIDIIKAFVISKNILFDIIAWKCVENDHMRSSKWLWMMSINFYETFFTSTILHVSSLGKDKKYENLYACTPH